MQPRSPPAPAFPPNWIRVPQRGYDYGRKQWNFERSEPISFSVNGRPGINMGDALRKSFAELDGRDDPVLQDAQGAISCRLLVSCGSPLGRQTTGVYLIPSSLGIQPTAVRPRYVRQIVVLPRIHHGVEDPCVGLDQEPSADNSQQASLRDCQETRTVSQLHSCKFVPHCGQFHSH